MHESVIVPSCFSAGERKIDDPAPGTRAGQSVFISVYQTKIPGQCRLITVTWCKNLLLHGLCISVQGLNSDYNHDNLCKVEIKPWHFWRKQGTKKFEVDGKILSVFWDFRNAKFDGKTEPRSDYYVAIVCDEEFVLLLGDLKKKAYQKTKCRCSLIEPILISRKEHVFGKRKFSTKVKFHEKDKFHDISIKCITKSWFHEIDPQMEVRIDGKLVIHVKHLQWKFRGNASINVDKIGVQVFWDVHDWLFSSGLRNGVFIFKLNASSSSSLLGGSSSLGSILMSTQAENSASGRTEENNACWSSRFCLFLYAWKVK